MLKADLEAKKPQLSLVPQSGDINPTNDPETWYVKLEAYALCNLSKSVYHIRHTITNDENATPSTFGTVTSQTPVYLYTPGWTAKNSVGTNAEELSDEVTGLFYQPFLDVAKAKIEYKDEKFDIQPPYKAIPTGTYNGDKVTGTDHYTEYPKLPDTGHRLAYCFENSTDANHQFHGTTTGIIFAASIWGNKECTEEIKTLYRYSGHLFQSIKSIQDAYGAATPEAINILAAKEANNEAITKDDCDAAEVAMYANNICYYYTAQIKHFDNNEPSMGAMEFAIMRNNIYSLAITGIDNIGDPYVEPNPSTPDETPKKYYMKVNIKILPWIVRYNDIEF